LMVWMQPWEAWAARKTHVATDQKVADLGRVGPVAAPKEVVPAITAVVTALSALAPTGS